MRDDLGKLCRGAANSLVRKFALTRQREIVFTAANPVPSG